MYLITLAMVRAMAAVAPLPDFIAGLGAVIAAGPQPFAIVAHSMGGAAALQAVRNGSPCSALVVIGAPASFDIHLKTLSRRVGLGQRAAQPAQTASSAATCRWPSWIASIYSRSSGHGRCSS